MCLAIPGKVVELKRAGKVAVVDYGSEKREALNHLQNAAVGDWVLVQQKVVVEVLDKAEALERANCLK